MWSVRLTAGVLLGLGVLGIGACGTNEDFDRDDAVARVQAEAQLDRADAACIVDGVLDEGLVAADFLDDPDADPRFAQVFERIATSCLL